MLKCSFGLIVFFLFVPIMLFSQTYKTITILPNSFFKDSEVLTYQLRYGFIIGGKVALETIETKGLFHLKGTAKTTGLADKLFSVKDIYESYIIKENGLPVLAIQNVKEGKTYKYYNEVRFNQKNKTVISTKSGEHEVPEGILDMISVFYYIRRVDFSDAKEGDIYKINTFFSDELFPFELRYKGRETIKTDFGKIRCIKFAPIVEPGRVFKSKDDMHIWYTDDENRIPILISMEMLVGHVNCELTGFKNLIKQPSFKK
jgi:hypothetical protein